MLLKGTCPSWVFDPITRIMPIKAVENLDNMLEKGGWFKNYGPDIITLVRTDKA